ncbi:MAG: S-methyl-5'-thioadenosine phosphorylase [Halobacteria archaeon]
MKPEPAVGIIGGSGLYEAGFLGKAKAHRVATPFGPPSDAIVEGRLEGRRVLFLSRHGRGHRWPPHKIPARANLWALKKLGSTALLSVSAVGSLKEEIAPLDVVVPDQLFDRTRSRPSTFFDDLTVHVSLAEPFCPVLRGLLAGGAREAGGKVHPRGTYVCVEGPQFSTKAESAENRRAGFDVVGMTALPEARLAREAQLCYGTLAFSTDYDVWKETEEVDVARILGNLRKNAALAQEVLRRVVPRIAEGRECRCRTALEGAVVTDLKRLPAPLRAKLKLLLGP